MPDEYILIVDDEPAVRDLLSSQIDYLGHRCKTACDGKEALGMAQGLPHPCLVLSDIQMPGVSGVDLLHQLKSLDDNIQVVMVSGLHDLETVRRCLREGAYDYLIKPFELHDLTNTVERALERSRLLRQNEHYRQNLEQMVDEQTQEIRETRNIALMTLAKLAESRDQETGDHLERIAAFSRRLSRQLQSGPHAAVVTDDWIDQLFKSSPLHDIGKVGIPDSVLLKPGPLTEDEYRIMQTHTIIGGDTLRAVIERYDGHTFLLMGMEIAYSHHEKWDGNGYPKGISGADIPMAARIVALVDAYDAITSDRPYKKAFSHEEAIRRILVDKGAHFDPAIVDAFMECHDEFRQIQQQLGGSAVADA